MECEAEQLNAINKISSNPIKTKTKNPNKIKLITSQKNVLKYVDKKSKIFVKNVRLQVNADFLTKGYEINDVELIVKYIQEQVDLVSHFKATDFKFFLNDDHFRNIFEIPEKKGSSYIKSRTDWETFLFNKAYDTNDVLPIEKVKYGTLNLLTDPL